MSTQKELKMFIRTQAFAWVSVGSVHSLTTLLHHGYKLKQKTLCSVMIPLATPQQYSNHVCSEPALCCVLLEEQDVVAYGWKAK